MKYKVKTSKTASKRIRLRAGGTYKTGRVGMNHNAMKAPQARKRRSAARPLSPTRVRSMRAVLPYRGYA